MDSNCGFVVLTSPAADATLVSPRLSPTRASALSCAAGSPAAELEQEDRRDQVTRALHQLPDQQRVPLVLFHFEEMSYQEIAAALGVSVGKVKTDIHRGREALRALLSDYAPR
jgi:RNA polymerase sigma factor (sigma-70 family)